MDIRATSNSAVTGNGFSGAKPVAAPAETVSARSGNVMAAREIAAQPGTEPPGKEELKHAIISINDVLKDRAPGLEFSVDGDSDRSVVKVVDKDTNEVIRQMPSHEAIDIAKALDKLQSLLAKQTA